MPDPTYPVPVNPVYDPEIRQLQNSDDADATEVINPVVERLIENTHAVKKDAEALAARSIPAVQISLRNFDVLDGAGNPILKSNGKPKTEEWLAAQIIGTPGPEDQIWLRHFSKGGKPKRKRFAHVDESSVNAGKTSFWKGVPNEWDISQEANGAVVKLLKPADFIALRISAAPKKTNSPPTYRFYNGRTNTVIDFVVARGTGPHNKRQKGAPSKSLKLSFRTRGGATRIIFS